MQTIHDRVAGLDVHRQEELLTSAGTPQMQSHRGG
jgi:hypothetical protein